MISPLTFLISGRTSSTTFAIASSDSEVDLSPSYLHLHSRQTRLKLMDPLANGTLLRAVKERMPDEGANAATVASLVARMESFIIDYLLDLCCDLTVNCDCQD